ncbi:MAG: hypothetical protein ACJ708_04220, partial [Nitrososphaeraceae archaeon]
TGLTLIGSVRLTPNFRRHCIRPKKFCLPCVSACRMTVSMTNPHHHEALQEIRSKGLIYLIIAVIMVRR